MISYFLNFEDLSLNPEISNDREPCLHRTRIAHTRPEEGWFWPYIDDFVLVYPNDIRSVIGDVPENVI